MTISIEQAAIDLAVAGGLSALIGFERQWRNRLAGQVAELGETSLDADDIADIRQIQTKDSR
jgi:hypothetical protein